MGTRQCKRHAGTLRVVTTFSTGINRGHEGQPLVFNNTMYVVTPFPNNLIAVDLTKPGGAARWIHEPHPDNRAVGIAYCDVVNRGAVYNAGNIIYSLLDANVVGVDADTGKEVWSTKVGDINKGETLTAAPRHAATPGSSMAASAPIYKDRRVPLEAKDIHRSSGRGHLLDVFHGADDSQRGVRVACRNFRKGDGATQNPFENNRDARGEGRQLFVRSNCSGCHGGRAHGMPSWGTKLSQDQVWKLVAYIQTLRTKDEVDPPA